jgi:hypothetical protein
VFDQPQGYWEIVPFASSLPSDQYVHILDRWSVEAFLRQFKFDYAIMSHMRAVLSSTDPVSRLTDDEVITTILARLVSGELLFRRKRWRRTSTYGGPRQEQAKPAAEVPLSAAAPAHREVESEPNTFSLNHDVQAQTAALEAAASLGIPFCKECEKQGAPN